MPTFSIETPDVGDEGWASDDLPFDRLTITSVAAYKLSDLSPLELRTDIELSVINNLFDIVENGTEIGNLWIGVEDHDPHSGNVVVRASGDCSVLPPLLVEVHYDSDTLT